VVAADHPLASVPGPLGREALEPYVQLVLTDRTDVTRHIQGGVVASRVWRFADLSTRLEFLLGGFGWCNMPLHMVESHILAGRLKRLTLAGSPEVELPLYVVHERGRRLGRAGRWLIDDLRARLKTCPGAHQRIDGHRPEADDLVA
jgi:DNA-binding transcriptional LysR family regulator